MFTPTDPRAAIASIRDAMTGTFHERRSSIDALLCAAIAGEHLVMLGPPGTAKSALLDAWTACLSDARTFDILMSRFTGPDEVFGPLKLEALKQDRYERATDDFLPGAHCAFLDELFKANSSILNALLKILNERTYAGAKAPLRMMVAASNELPEDETLNALYDRVLCRVVVAYIADDDKWKDMLRGGTFVPPVRLTVADWDAIRASAATIPVPDAVLDALVALKAELAKQGLVISDRRWKALLKILRAQAWLDGASSVESAHLYALTNCLWNKPEEIPVVRAALTGSDSGALGGFLKKIDDALGSADGITRDPDKRRDALLAAMGSIGKLTNEIKADPERLKLSPSAKERLKSAVAEMKVTSDKLSAELTKTFGLAITGSSSPL